MEPGGFVTKGADRKMLLDQRQARIAASAGEPDDNGDKEEMEQERLEHEANEEGREWNLRRVIRTKETRLNGTVNT